MARSSFTHSRAGVAVAIVPLAAACVLAVAACGGSAAHDAVSRTSTGGTITLRARAHRGPWRNALSLKLVKTSLTEFSLCAVRNVKASESFECRARGRLPVDTTLRLEQDPTGRGIKRADSPGWGMLAASSTASIGAVLSNTVTGDVTGRFRYRVTLRDKAGKVLVRSNVLPIDWHR
jgi:hypothetical protein